MTTLRAYHSDPAIKAKYIARVEAHRALDQLVPGATGANGRGCSVYCTFDVYDHSRGPNEIGVPTELMRLNDSTFEGLARWATKDEYLAWPTRFLGAIREGADLSGVWPRFALWVLRGLPPQKRDDVRAAVAGVIALYERWVAGDKPTVSEWRKARSSASASAAAAYAADYAASAAAYAASAYAADYAASAAADAAAYAADYAASADYAARRSFWRAAANELIRLLTEAPVVEASK